MKKLITTMLAAVMISSCVVTPAFAYSSDIPSVGQQEYADNDTTKINAFHTDARVYPTSQAPVLKNTKTINGVVFSEYIKHTERDMTLQNGEKIHQYNVYIGMEGAMHSSASDARFVYHRLNFHTPAKNGEEDNTVTTGERTNAATGIKFVDLENYLIKPFADKKSSAGTGGEYVGNLTWQFMTDEEEWAVIESDRRDGLTDSHYFHSYNVITFVNGVKSHFIVYVTTEGTPKGSSIQTVPVQTVATPTSSKIYVNGEKVKLDVFNINGSNYFKLRDVAYVLTGTEKQFDVDWDAHKRNVALTTGQSYSGDSPSYYFDVYSIKGKQTDSPICVDGVQKDLTAYNLAGSNFFKLRDLGQTFDFHVGWDSATQSVTIDTTRGYQ